jgi:hypothetical protein
MSFHRICDDVSSAALVSPPSADAVRRTSSHVSPNDVRISPLLRSLPASFDATASGETLRIAAKLLELNVDAGSCAIADRSPSAEPFDSM